MSCFRRSKQTWSTASTTGVDSVKVTVKELRQVIHEEYMRGLPEYVLRQATERYVDEIRKQIFRYVLANKSDTDVNQRNAMAATNEVLEDLEEKVNDLLEDSLFQFLQRV